MKKDKMMIEIIDHLTNDEVGGDTDSWFCDEKKTEALMKWCISKAKYLSLHRENIQYLKSLESLDRKGMFDRRKEVNYSVLVFGLHPRIDLCFFHTSHIANELKQMRDLRDHIVVDGHILCSPTFYKENPQGKDIYDLFFMTVDSDENVCFLRLNESEYAEFKKMGICHKIVQDTFF